MLHFEDDFKAFIEYDEYKNMHL